MGLLELLGNGSKKDHARFERRLDDIEDILRSLDLKADDKFETILQGINTVIPHEKGQFINRLEERLITIKRDMILSAIIAECVREPKSYPEIRRGIAGRTSLNFSRAFLDLCMRRLSYEGKLDRMGSRFIAAKKSAGLLGKIDEHAIASEIAPDGNPAQPIPTPPVSPIAPRAPPAKAAPPGKLEKLEKLLKLVEELEGDDGAAPVEAVLRESWKYGMDEKAANELLDEHLMITGQLYEPKQGHVKLVKPV